MGKSLASADKRQEYVPHHVMEPGPLSDRKLTGTWKDYVSVTKVGIILGNLLTVITAMWLASGGSLSGQPVFLTLLGTAFIIASGTCLNNYIDRDIDQKMARTKKRALAEGRLEPNHVMRMGLILAVLGTVMLLTVNLLATVLALTGLFGYVFVYTMWLKRTHTINTLIGSIAGAIPPMIGWAAVTNSLEPGAWILFLIMFIWQPPHFFALAMRRCEDYRAAGIPMLPAVKGFHETKRQMLSYVVILIPASLLLFTYTDIGWSYFWMALILGVLWFSLSVVGFYVKDEILWARRYFVFSLIYLTVMFVGMIVITI